MKASLSPLLNMFSNLVFDDEQMRKWLDKKTYQQFRLAINADSKEILDIALANKIAEAMKNWAISKGATHYTHWFQPLNGTSAEKHESFITTTFDGKVILNFTGKDLIKGETDGSSFPSGGLRNTHEARGYTAWDASNFAFVRNECLYIPALFSSYTGEVLDKMTPLHRSSTLLKHQAIRLCKLFKKHSNHARVVVGPEQEYFLIDKQMYDKRLDLKLTGRTLFGAKPPKSQELADHYYGQIKTRVMNYMIDLDKELWKLGIPSKTRHNEVAPCQHELAPIFERISKAIYHNILIMEVMKKTAEKHGLVCLLHEKPFRGVNGSGKHNNWSVSVDGVGNLLDPGPTPENNFLFLLFICCVMKGVDEYQDIIRMTVASANNDHRLGAHEAPPAIISIFLGNEIYNVLHAFVYNEKYSKSLKKQDHRLKYIVDMDVDTTDRNRTSPFAFTGNKFEFRMPGSSMNLASVNTVLNTIVADAISSVCDRLEKSKNLENDIKKMIRETYLAHKRILFNGNGYSHEWELQAKKLGLLNIKDTPTAIKQYSLDKNIALFERHKIFTRQEILARQIVLFEEYIKQIKIEAVTMTSIFLQQISPAVSKYEKHLATLIHQKKQIKVEYKMHLAFLEHINDSLLEATLICHKIIKDLDKIDNKELSEKALSYHKYIFKSMNDLRSVCDILEHLCPKTVWPFPTYSDILFF